jgi:glutamate 5-kinase
MHNKLAIARKVARLGTEVVIADGTDAQIMSKILGDHQVGTRFPALGVASSAKRWLASANDHATGSVTINQGAAEALLDSSLLASLLPVGVDAVDGHFEQGDVIRILSSSGKMLGCGKARYNHIEASQLMGQRGQKPLIHYDYLYLIG